MLCINVSMFRTSVDHPVHGDSSASMNKSSVVHGTGTRYRPSGLNRARCGTWCWTWSAEKTWCQTSRPSCPPAPSWRPYPGTSQSECLEQQSLMLSSFQNNYKYKNILKLNWSSYSVVHLLVRHTCHTPTSVENIWQLLGQKCPKKGITSTHFIF